jgi:hypothetical protein
MSIIWLESFDYMGTNNANLLLRGYVAFGSFVFGLESGSTARTGSGNGVTGSFISHGITRVLNASETTIGQGVGIFFTTNQENGVNSNGLRFGVTGNDRFVRVVANANLGFNVFINDVLVGSSANNVYVQGSYYWLESKVITGTGTASVEVRLGGVTILVVNGLTIPAIVSCSLAKEGGNNTFARYDDWVIWNGSGSINNNFLGDRRIVTLYPNADTSEADWTPSSGSDGFAMIDEATPSDADFVTANNAGDISDFDKNAIPSDVNTVAAVCPVARAFKDSAGTSTFRVGINSAGNVENSEQFSPNTTISYFSAIFETNPNGGGQWTKSAVDAASVRLTREL